MVIAVEAIEGTDETIKRAGNLSKNNILIKVAKNNHDFRFDIPTIGIETINNCIQSNINIIAIENSSCFVINKEEVLNKAKNNNIKFVVI
jgi:DUF1009 family protein